MLYFIGKLALSIGLACLVSVLDSILTLVILSKIVDFLELNYKGNTYWAITVALVNLGLMFVISLGCFMSILK